MSAGRHAIVTTSPGPATVLRGGPVGGVYTDDEFYALPLVRQFGGFPAGYAAIHFGIGETASRLDALPRDERDSAIVLADLLRTIQASRYAIRVGDVTMQRTGSKREAGRLLRRAVGEWRGGGLPGQKYRASSYTATRLERHIDGERTGALPIAWQLRYRGNPVKTARVDDDGLQTLARLADRS